MTQSIFQCTCTFYFPKAIKFFYRKFSPTKVNVNMFFVQIYKNDMRIDIKQLFYTENNQNMTWYTIDISALKAAIINKKINS